MKGRIVMLNCMAVKDTGVRDRGIFTPALPKACEHHLFPTATLTPGFVEKGHHRTGGRRWDFNALNRRCFLWCVQFNRKSGILFSC